MVDTIDVSTNPNGDEPAPVDRRLSLPAVVAMSATECGRVPSPGTQRALKAQTGKGFDELVGANADTADRFQTFIWMKLRRDIPDLRWDECGDVEIDIEEGAFADPTKLAVSASSPPSVASGE
jgi:hypothetical protein